MKTQDKINALRGDVQEGAKLIIKWMQAYEAEKAENERLRGVIHTAIDFLESGHNARGIIKSLYEALEK